MANIKLALRTLFRTPFVTAVAVLSLALGIGANAAIFSLFNQMLLRPLPVPNPGSLVNLAAPGPNPGSQSCSQAGDCTEVWSYPMFRDLEKAQKVFTGIAAHRTFSANLAFRNQTLDAQGLFVSGSYFPVLQLQPAVGRLLGPADDQTIGAHQVAVLAYNYWETRLGKDPSVVCTVTLRSSSSARTSVSLGRCSNRRMLTSPVVITCPASSEVTRVMGTNTRRRPGTSATSPITRGRRVVELNVTTTSRTRPTGSPNGSKTRSPARRAQKTRGAGATGQG